MLAAIGSVIQKVNMLGKPSSPVDAILHFYQTTRRDVTECGIVSVFTTGPSGPTVCWFGGIAGSNPAGSRDVFLSYEICALLGGDVWERPITFTEESYRVYCVWVWYQKLQNEGALTQLGLLCYRQKC